MHTAETLPLAIAAFRKHFEEKKHFNHYTGILSMHAFARLATETGDSALLTEIRDHLAPFLGGERTDFWATLKNYYCGGNASAWLFYRGQLSEHEATITQYAEQLMNEAPRDDDDVFCRVKDSGLREIWIDIAFAVTPFLLFTGLKLGRDDYVEEAFQQTAKMVQIFRLPDTGLLVQSRNIRSEGHMSEDHWSRGNGWGALAMAELAAYLPNDHPRKEEAVAMFRDHVAACAKFQDEQGMWHQEMTDLKESYVETSGTGLMLYSIGLGLEAGLLDQSDRERFLRGLRGMLDYIDEDTNIFHTCRGCLCPGQGTKLEYRAMPPVLNDAHAFGPVTLAFGQAHKLGITTI